MATNTLMSHQKDGVDFIEDNDGIAALLWDPGVGKTGTALAWIDRLAARKGEARVLVIAPAIAADTWVLQVPAFMDSSVKARLLEGRTVDILTKMRKAGRWMGVPRERVSVNHRGNGNKVTILSVSAGAISSYCTNDPVRVDKNGKSRGTGEMARQRTTRMLQAVRKFQPDLVIVDESHIIKAATSNISKAVYNIGQLAPHRIILTGTVNPHSALDCYGQWRFLAPWTFSDHYGAAFTKTPLLMTRAQAKSIKPWSWKRFVHRYADTFVPRGAPAGAEQIGDMNDDTIAELHSRVAERSMVVRKEDALNLPPTTDVDVHVTLSPKETRLYNEMRDELAAELDSGELLEAPNALAKIMKLRQITAGFLRDTENDVVHVIGKAKQRAVADVVNVNLAGEQRVVVFAYFKSECAAIAKMLEQKGRVVETITGATSAKDRLAIRRRFLDVSGNPTPTVLIAQARTMSVSVNELITAQNAVFASLSERREDWVQGRGRLDRNGQTLPVTFWNVTVPGTVDEVMLENNKRRGSLEKALLDHIKMTPR